jgi:PAS domain S-box-containing protein
MRPDDAALFERAPCGLLVLATDGTIRRANRTFCEWLGYREDELRTRRLQDLLTVGARVFHLTHWAPLLQIQGSAAELKLDALRRDGRKVPMLFNTVRHRQGDETWDEVAAVIVTDRQRYEQELLVARRRAEAAQAQLSEADRRKDEFLATLAHELRNPLAPMRNVVQLLKLKTFDDPQVAWGRDVLERQLAHMTLLVDDLLDISRITQGKVFLKRTRLDVRHTIEVAVEAAEPFIVVAQHQLVIDLPPRPVHLHADPTRVTQMVLNLLNNAAKYTPNGGRIELTVSVDGGNAVIRVRDNGVGLSADHLPMVFEMFSQITPAKQRTEGGLGIGLSLVRGLAELHGGSVSASSPGVGLGSEFTIVLPLATDMPDAPAPEERVGEMPDAGDRSPNHGASRRRIVIVEDNLDLAESLSMLLEVEGHEVRIVTDGRGAVAACDEFRPNLVLLDIGLPGIDGFEVARRLRAEPWGGLMLIVAMTGWGQQKDIDDAIKGGFDAHATKPVSEERLHELLGLAAQRPELLLTPTPPA